MDREACGATVRGVTKSRTWFSDWTEPPTSWETGGHSMQVRKQQLEPDMEQWIGSELGKEYVKAIYRHPAYLTSMYSTSYKMSG